MRDVRSLTRDISQLSPDEFETLVYLVLKAKYPGASITKVEGAGGDAGIDTFSGQLSSGPAIWQAKAFSRIRSPQRSQILSSISTALKHKPVSWTLCVPFDLRTQEHYWFENAIVKAFASHTSCLLMQGCDFVSALLVHTRLRDSLLPNSMLETAVRIRDAALNVDRLTIDQRRTYSTASTASFLDQYRKLDSRFSPIATFSTHPTASLPVVPGSVFAIRNQGFKVDFVPDDRTDYDLNPINIKVSLDGSFEQQLNEALDFGRNVTLPAGAVRSIDSSSDLVRHILGESNATDLQVSIGPVLVDTEPLLLDLVPVSVPSEALSCLSFKLARSGRKEVELRCQSTLGLVASMLLPSDEGASVQISFSLDVRDVFVNSLIRTLRFLDALSTGSELEVRMSESRQVFLKSAGNYSGHANISREGRQLLEDLVVIASKYDSAIKMPAEFTRADLQNVETLKRICTGERFEGGVISTSLVKEKSLEDAQISLFNGEEFALLLDQPRGLDLVEILGTKITPGPVYLVADCVRLIDVEATREKYEAAEHGDAIPISAECLKPLYFTSKPDGLTVVPTSRTPS